MPLPLRQAGLAETLVASAARTASGNSAPLSGFGSYKQAVIQLNVTAASGTSPNLVVNVEDSVDGGANWNTVQSFTAKTAAGREAIRITNPFADLIRVSWTISGTTPSFTFAVDAFFKTDGMPVSG